MSKRRDNNDDDRLLSQLHQFIEKIIFSTFTVQDLVAKVSIPILKQLFNSCKTNSILCDAPRNIKHTIPYMADTFTKFKEVK